jgi:drug/metabolite transporter (DMT)-like permease
MAAQRNNARQAEPTDRCDANHAGINRGDLWVMLGAVFWAVHVGVLGRSPLAGRILPLALMQMLVCAMLSACSSWTLSERWDGAAVEAAMWPLGYAGLLSGGVAYAFQIYGQSRVVPPVAAIFF